MKIIGINPNKLRLAAAGAAAIVLGAAAVTLWLRGQGVDQVKTDSERTRDHAAFRSALIEEMNGRFANPNDPLDVSRFRIGTSTAFIGATATKDRLEEARKRLDVELGTALKKAGLNRGEDPRFEAGWHCATWLLDGEKGNTPEGLLTPTVIAYNAGDFGTVIDRCAGAEANLMAQSGRPDGKFHYLYDMASDWTPPTLPPIPEGPSPAVVPTLVAHN